ncbi:MAG: hypothetical protein AVDCRST_MAG49-1519 [uncultured Thermomicrobiales bacterium]|uniref:Uncharacterized protein n=1 Tax=uncultured Thermomicrobiales bacterium TaxID=1645740 RepID=A0A6J4UEX6_9BACT|nr:MAG: hypothetical protein AVDCRST_MAG49-1519 [uncultured Thermomicrobiales bacterium]
MRSAGCDRPGTGGRRATAARPIDAVLGRCHDPRSPRPAGRRAMTARTVEARPAGRLPRARRGASFGTLGREYGVG